MIFAAISLQTKEKQRQKKQNARGAYLSQGRICPFLVSLFGRLFFFAQGEKAAKNINNQ
ncbi:MAG: hypothetical protein IKG32_00350 [Clostridia bacterium]|nr:hypothetical protein [Clostridia bacterium]